MGYKISASCPRKAKARFDTIIDTYRKIFQKNLPKDRQYWTLAGPCFDENNDLGKCSELHQLVSSGLIDESQYHGIDNGIGIIERNLIAAPNANFYHGDFVTTLQEISNTGKFNPGIIHADYTKMKDISVVDTSNIVYLLESNNISNVMVVMNLPYNNPYAGAYHGNVDPSEIMEALKTNQRFNASWNDRWNLYPDCYTYKGTGERSKTTMISFIIYNK
jgi:hypothetical protein